MVSDLRGKGNHLKTEENLKLQRLKKSDFSWFDIGKYDALKEMKLDWWSGGLMLRAILRSMAKQQSRHTEIDGKMLNMVITNPVPTDITPKYRGAILSKGFSSVYDRTSYDVFSDRYALDNENLADIREAGERFYEQMEIEKKFLSRPKILDESFDDALTNRGFTDQNRVRQVNVDIAATDEQLILDFKEWLSKKREVTCIRPPSKNLSEKDMNEWIKHRVLALIDIDIFCLYTNTTISNAVVGALLFPEEFDVDLSERIRKVVRPLARTLTAHGFIGALDNQLAVAERKRKKTIPD